MILSFHLTPRLLWGSLDNAAKQALTPSSMISEAKSVLEDFPQKVLDEVKEDPNKFVNLFDSDTRSDFRAFDLNSLNVCAKKAIARFKMEKRGRETTPSLVEYNCLASS